MSGEPCLMGLVVRCVCGTPHKIRERTHFSAGRITLTSQLVVEPCETCQPVVCDLEHDRLRERIAQIERHIVNEPGEPVPPWQDGEPEGGDPLNPARALLGQLSGDQRLALLSRYCRGCGWDNESGERVCRCWDDE